MLKPHAFYHAPYTLEPSHWSCQPCLPLVFQPEASNSCTSPNPWGLWECTNSRVLDKVSGPLTGLVTEVPHADPVGDAGAFGPQLDARDFYCSTLSFVTIIHAFLASVPHPSYILSTLTAHSYCIIARRVGPMHRFRSVQPSIRVEL